MLKWFPPRPVIAALCAVALVAGQSGCGEDEERRAITVAAADLDLREGNGSAEEDGGAYATRVLRLFGDDTAVRRVELPAARHLTVRARADECEGWPELDVRVDGETVLKRPVESEDFTEYRGSVEIEAGAREVSIGPMGDLANDDCDRTLIVDQLRFSTHKEKPQATPEDGRRAYDRAVASTDHKLLFDADFADGFSEYPYRVHRERIDVVPDPVLGKRRQVLRFKVFQSDTGPTDNPRAQIETPYDFEEGDDRYFGYSILLPEDFPDELPEQAWVTLGEQAYGPPFDGAAGTSLRIQNVIGDEAGAELRWQRNDTYDNDIPWRGPRIADVKGRWIDVVQRIRLSSDADEGFVELWLNTGDGWAKQKLDGRERLYMQTYDEASDDGPNNSRLSLYYRNDIPGPLTLYHGDHRIASAGRGAFEAVDPASYDD